MTIGRLGGDWVQVRVGPTDLIRLAAVIAGSGSLIAALVPNVAVSIVGFLVAGLGTSVLFPQLYDRAARSPGPPGSGFASMLIGQRGAGLLTPLRGRRVGRHRGARRRPGDGDRHRAGGRGGAPHHAGPPVAARVTYTMCQALAGSSGVREGRRRGRTGGGATSRSRRCRSVRIGAGEFALGGLCEVATRLARRVDEGERDALEALDTRAARCSWGRRSTMNLRRARCSSSTVSASRHHVDSLPSGARLAPIFSR